MPPWAVPAILGANSALSLLGGFQARREAKKARSRQLQQDAHQHLGNMLSAAGTGGGGGFRTPRQTPVPSAMQTVGSALDPLVRDLLPVLMQQDAKKKASTNNPKVDVNQLQTLISLLEKITGP